MAALPYIQLYVADYLSDTAHLTTEEHGAYLLLIFNYWQTGKPLNNSNGRLANVARMCKEDWQRVEPILSEFFVIEGNEWGHKRVEADLDAVLVKSTKNSAAGKASAMKRLNGRSTVVQRSFNHTDTDTDTDTDTEKEKDGQEQKPSASTPPKKKSSPSRFVVPSLEAVQEYCKERGCKVDPHKWHDHYASNGWKVGKNSMKDWRAAVRTWEKNEIGGKTYVKKAPPISVKEQRARDLYYDVTGEHFRPDNQGVGFDVPREQGRGGNQLIEG